MDIGSNSRLYPYRPAIDGPYEPETIIDGRNILMFSSNNCLGLLNDPRVIAAAAEGLRKWGIGTGSCPFPGANSEIQKRLEDSIADFKGKEACLTFSTGFLANSGTLPAIVDVADPSLLMLENSLSGEPETAIFGDESNHALAMAGIKMRSAVKEIYKHNNMSDLKQKLERYSRQQRKLIIVEGISGMEGDIAPLPDILSLAQKYNAMVYLDDANATGILGRNGRGVEDYYCLNGEVDVVVGTLARGFGGEGGFVVGRKALIDYLRISAKTYIFSAPISPPIACGLLKAVEIMREESWRRMNLIENARYLRDALLEMGLSICGSQTHIIPILICDEGKTYAAAQFMSKHGILIPTTMWPSVPEGRARLRISIMYNHTKDQLDYLISVIKKMKKAIIDAPAGVSYKY